MTSFHTWKESVSSPLRHTPYPADSLSLYIWKYENMRILLWGGKMLRSNTSCHFILLQPSVVITGNLFKRNFVGKLESAQQRDLSYKWKCLFKIFIRILPSAFSRKSKWYKSVCPRTVTATVGYLQCSSGVKHYWLFASEHKISW